MNEKFWKLGEKDEEQRNMDDSGIFKIRKVKILKNVKKEIKIIKMSQIHLKKWKCFDRK